LHQHGRQDAGEQTCERVIDTLQQTDLEIGSQGFDSGFK
jgi:hypothetical protein